MKIIFADDHPVFRSGMSAILSGIFDQAEIFEVGDAQGLDKSLSDIKTPDLLIVDLFFPGFDYKKDLAILRQRLALTPIIALSMLNDLSEIETILSTGINGFISKSVSPSEIVSAIHEVMRGEVVVRTSDDVFAHKGHAGPTQFENLTPRQLEVLDFLKAGLTNKEIARELELSPFTVRSHVSALMKVLGVSSRAGASALAAGREFVVK